MIKRLSVLELILSLLFSKLFFLVDRAMIGGGLTISPKPIDFNEKLSSGLVGTWIRR